jgi:spore coat polysaccharide biosynthesis protein SpsF (cytidylyltransferase family)
MTDRRSSVAIIDLGSQSCNDHPSLRSIGRHSLLEWTVQRLAGSSLLDTIVITGSTAYSSFIEALDIEPARWISSESSTPLRRCIDVARLVQANWVVLVQNNCPFVDPILVDRLVAAAWATPTSDMISFVSSTRPTSSLRSLGLVAEVCRRRALRRLSGRTDANDQRDVTQLIHSMPELFHARCLPLPTALDREGLHWALETEDDWDKAHMLLDSQSESIDYRELANLAIHCDTSRLRVERRAR